MTQASPLTRALVVPGAQKSGTTLLFDVLSTSPDVRVPRYKEPQFWALDPETVEEHLDWYQSIFDDSGTTYLDASTFYLFFPERSARLIDRWVEEPRIVVSLRDPAERAYSAYLHLKKQVPSAEERSFSEILQAIEARSTGDSIVEAERRAALDALCEGDIRHKFLDRSHAARRFDVDFESSFPDLFAAFLYVANSCYRRAAETYREVFGDRLYVMFFEAWLAEPERELGEMFEFAGVTPPDDLSELPVANPTKVPRGDWARRFVRWRRTVPGFGALVESIEGLGIREFVSKTLLRRDKPSLDRETYRHTRRLLEDEYDYWFDRHPPLETLWRFDE
jgi:hypothetical protein